MITGSFDAVTPAKLAPPTGEGAPRVDACICPFSQKICDDVLRASPCERIGWSRAACGDVPVYRFAHGGRTFAFFLSYIGAPACVAMLEDTRAAFQTETYVLFGGAGCLDREIARGKVMVPTAAWRDEGTSYHYAPAADEIALPGAPTVAAFCEEMGLPYALGKTWTTDAIFRETEANIAARKAAGCICVEMECAAVQALCAYRAWRLYAFFTSGDLLDAPKWDARLAAGQVEHSQHDPGHFAIALALAHYTCEH